MGKRIGQGLLILLGVGLLASIFGSSGEDSGSPTPSAVATVAAGADNSAPSPNVQTASPTSGPTSALTTEAPAQSPTKTEPSITIAQENAIEKAQDYLSYTAFSRTGLIDQLKFEGFSTADATFAVDYLDVDWNEQAAKKAQDYLDFSSFSRSGLIDQLIFEGFTREQATYGADAVGL